MANQKKNQGNRTETGKQKALVLFSGGIDSTTCLALAVRKYGSEQVTALSLNYGQRHEKEISSAVQIAEYYGVRHQFMDLTPVFQYSDSALLHHSSRTIPEKSYAEQLQEKEDEPVSTYVPFRNGLFLSVAASLALSLGCQVIYYGAHRDDAAGNAYPDCSASFNQSMKDAIYVGSGNQLVMEAPFIQSTKADVVRTGLALHAPYHLTWSCYEGGERPCGRCATCLDRARAFAENGVSDPALITENEDESR